MTGLETETGRRRATVQAEGYVAAEKVHALGRLTRDAMSGHVMLRRWADVLGAGDIMVRDELSFFAQINDLGASEIIARTVDRFCQEGGW